MEDGVRLCPFRSIHNIHFFTRKCSQEHRPSNKHRNSSLLFFPESVRKQSDPPVGCQIVWLTELVMLLEVLPTGYVDWGTHLSLQSLKHFGFRIQVCRLRLNYGSNKINMFCLSCTEEIRYCADTHSKSWMLQNWRETRTLFKVYQIFVGRMISLSLCLLHTLV